MTKPAETTVMMVGYQGYGNLGDEAILSGIERLLEGSGLHTAVVAGGKAGPIPAFPGAARVLMSRPWPSRASIGALRRVRVLVLSGGGLLHDHFASVVPGYLAWTLLGRLMGRKVVWLGVGIGPLRRRPSRVLAGLALRLSTLVLARDAASAALAREIGGRVDGVMPDPAIFLEAAPPAEAKSGRLAVVVRAPIRDDAAARRLGDALAAFIAAEHAAGWSSEVLTFGGPRDAAFAASVAGHSAAVRALGPDPEAALRILAGFEAIVTVRLHGMLLAAVQGVPFVAIGYDDKISGIASELNAAELVEPLASVSAGALHERLRRAESPETRGRIAARVGSLQAEAPRVRAALRAALGLIPA